MNLQLSLSMPEPMVAVISAGGNLLRRQVPKYPNLHLRGNMKKRQLAQVRPLAAPIATIIWDLLFRTRNCLGQHTIRHDSRLSV